MRNPKIARMLKYYRSKNNLSVNEVSEYLSDKNLSAAPKTIYGWESGQTQPPADTLMALCSYYGIQNVLETFGYDTEHQNELVLLSKEENALIHAYRMQSPEIKQAINRILKLENN